MADGRITFSTALDNKQLAKDIALTSKQIELVFDAAGKIFEAGAKYFDELVQSNAEYQAQVAKLRGALATAFQPLYEVALPICMTILQVLTDIANVAASVLSGLFGKTAKESADNAKALNKEAAAIKGVGSAAKEAKKSLASFDQINRLGEEQSGGGGGGGASGLGMDFSDIGEELTDTQKKIAEILKSVLLVAVGLKLWKIGSGLPGILGTIAKTMGGVLVTIGGIVMLWDGLKDAMENGMDLSNLFEIVGGLLAIGVGIGIITGVWIPLLIAAIAAALLALAYFTGHGDELIQGLRDTFGGMVDFVVALVNGDWDGAMEGMKRSFTGLQETAVAILDSINDGFQNLVDWLNELTGGQFEPIFENIKGAFNGLISFIKAIVTGEVFTREYWAGKFAAIGDGLKEAIKNGINAAIGLVNQFINWLNNGLTFDIPAVDLGILGSFGGAHMQLVSIPNIPLLAQGAVIPPNAPFVAMLGDQRNGTNLEAPEALIRQIVREEAGNNERMEALLEALLEAVRNIRVGDDTIGRAASRYIARTDRALGR